MKREELEKYLGKKYESHFLMGRKILFKAKRADNREWVEGSLVCLEDGKRFILPSKTAVYIPEHETTICSCECFEVIPGTLSQYIGLADRNGKKIWENDIIAFTDMFSTENGYSEADCTGKVIWCDEEACFHVTGRLSAESWEVLWDCVVIGNVFDNPELLESGAE